MDSKNKPVTTIDAYIATFPMNIQVLLEKLRDTIREVAPEAEEAISYQMPTYKLKGNLVHFAAYKNHIGFYPTPSAIVNFKDALKNYTTSKGAIQFPIEKSIPTGLVKKIVRFRVKENVAKGPLKSGKKKPI